MIVAPNAFGALTFVCKRNAADLEPTHVGCYVPNASTLLTFLCKYSEAARIPFVKTPMARNNGASAGAMAQARPAAAVFEKSTLVSRRSRLSQVKGSAKNYCVWLQGHLNPAPCGDPDTPNRFRGASGATAWDRRNRSNRRLLAA
jgi:hypothetical protein